MTDSAHLDRINANAATIADEQMATLLANTTASKALYERAVRSMPGGVASSFQLGDPYPIYLEKGVGAEVWDVDGTGYYDFHNGFGSIAVGHSNPIVAEAVAAAAYRGMHFAVTVESTVALAEELCRRFDVDQVRFTNSGTESNMTAIRVARAAAHGYGRPLVSAEAFCWLLDGLAVTPQQLRERADVFFAHGAQQLIGHGASAPMAGQPADAPPWCPFAGMEIGTPLDEANTPLWPMLRPLADYLARCQTLLQRGRAVVPVAVLAPLDLFAFTGAAERLTPPPWHEALLDAGLDWDWINGDTLRNGRLDGDAFVTPGGHRYRAHDPGALLWVFATLLETSLMTYELGVDHLLFLLGLLAIVRTPWMLVKTITATGNAVDEALKAKIAEVCTCGAEASVGEFKEGMTFADMMALKDDPAFRQKIGEIMASCREKVGGL